MARTIKEKSGITIEAQIVDKLSKYFSTNPQDATQMQIYKAVSLVIRDILLKKKNDFNDNIKKQRSKRVYYLCMEFLVGRSLRNNLYNLSLTEEVASALKKFNHSLDDLYELESDPGLGNGGLGRLAACFMDSLATQDYPAMGFSIRYEYGLFKQKIVDNTQVELPDQWLDSGGVWLMPRSDKSFQVKFGGKIEEKWDNGKLRISHVGASIVEASPYDMMISGKDSKGVSVLRLWDAHNVSNFDMKSFTQGDYMNAMKADNEAELISKVLYPSDSHYQGRQLRLSQQYFLVSSSLQNIMKDHLRFNKNFDNLADKVAIHINDTHPALAIPELMRLLMDEWDYNWDDAWEITNNTIAYTNHTVMAEALEKWDEELIALRLPRIYMIMKEIDNRFCWYVGEITHGALDKIDRMKIFSNGVARMANLSVVGSHSVNGVSALHSDIIKNSVFKDFNDIYKDKFTNVTNGIAHRRWLNQSNPRLSEFISSAIGDGFILDASQLSKLLPYKDDASFLTELGNIKQANKNDFSQYLSTTFGYSLNPNSRIDVQVKRLHEYKRQLMNVLKIISLYITLKDNPNMDFTPQTFIFGAKAAGSYYHAKRIIQLINCMSTELSHDKNVAGKLDIFFIENYNVSKAEHIFPASEVSEQISLAGKEASGTSNMKFMMNGAITLGTIDGANVEILQEVGADNIFTFGLTTKEVDGLWRNGYCSTEFVTQNEMLRRVLDTLRTGFAGQSFADIANYLVMNNMISDPYMCLADYHDYMRAHNEMDIAYRDKTKWNSMSLVNIAKSGVFSSDRSIRDYAEKIWNLQSLKTSK